MQMTSSELHHMILHYFLESGYAPDLAAMASYFGETRLHEIRSALVGLEEQHGVVLHPDKESVWIVHPLSTAPTNFRVHAKGMIFWGNCAWCSLGAAALLQPNDVTISTTSGAEGEPLEIQIVNGQLTPTSYLVHFPVPMAKAWDNVVYTCSVMLLFKGELEIESWCKRHRIHKGDVLAVSRVWAFAKAWYGNHLSKTWKKWTEEEAIELFRNHGLSRPIWTVSATGKRF
jgi:hypothetical protein